MNSRLCAADMLEKRSRRQSSVSAESRDNERENDELAVDHLADLLAVHIPQRGYVQSPKGICHANNTEYVT